MLVPERMQSPACVTDEGKSRQRYVYLAGMLPDFLCMIGKRFVNKVLDMRIKGAALG
jgi:hypothetical protein